jgi:hypothetical protein
MELTAAFLTTEDRRLMTALLESKQADVAQLVEQPIRNRQVSGSSPLVGSSFPPPPTTSPLYLERKH